MFIYIRYICDLTTFVICFEQQNKSEKEIFDSQQSAKKQTQTDCYIIMIFYRNLLFNKISQL